MTLTAEVIVDVPTMQTDQPFTYLVPSEMETALQVGMRVEVPFGNGNRHVQGFVMAIQKSEESANPSLKAVIRLLDLAPVVNEELLSLADYMKKITYAFKITCLQTMLPSVMKAEYDKLIYPLADTPEVQVLFDQREVISWKEAEEKGSLSQLIRWRQEQLVDIKYEVHTRNKVKTIRLVRSLLTEKQIEEEWAKLRQNAKKQKELLLCLSELSQEEPIAYFKNKGISTAVLNQGKEKGWLKFIESERYRDPYKDRVFDQTTALELNAEQKNAVEQIITAGQQQKDQVFLLEGITGSGKTEVYLQAIADVLSENKTAIMLVPEIALTPQMVERFKGRFGESVAVLHSGLSQGEKYDEWRKIEREEAQVVVGARSAIFAPLKNIGLIIIDEEHESSYKQDETPRYHARDLAIWRSKYHHCPIVLGSATPSLESRARAQKGVYQLLQLNHRAKAAAQLPAIEIVDMREEFQNHRTSTFSANLQEKIQNRLDKKEQTVLLLNRRGYSSFVMCRDCGFVLPCPNCDISLTLHMDTRSMRCHYCGHEEPIPNRCPNCGGNKIRYYGTGTQKVEEELRELYPQARILRMDVDTTRRKGAHEQILQKFGAKEADILLGTQMIAKGLDFPEVTLVGVLNADTSLNLPDFRSSEHTFQLLTQVSGRAGRAEKAGEVVIQTFNPQHYAIELAKKQNYEQFYQQEMHVRHRGGYPPYYFTVKITASHPEEQVAAKKIFQIANQLKEVLSPQSLLLGPTPSMILRVKNRYYYQLIIKYKHEPNLPHVLDEILNGSQKEQRQGLFVAIDNEPLNFI
ncbi:primosomal protein N' [Enterococcus faecium]|uniref:Replication restart protein PriA n=1 Tax=Enterococcus faecium TaxID=1352 RepID=A0AAW8RGT0_ENTFC|nr:MULTISPECIES: primosomal protein N' [Enterococcus]MBW4141636.1 primosomal protein N' [Enterococcus faecium]MCZ1505543.1 primosomal protein N' [Enterococcus faecium]MDQ8644300.1 primosomal protein N' [Enterococcus sp. FR169]MDT2307564.1 primosomal protein N' [Enterococcus faecium]MDT2364246.1 primosomal protein N' [Enterococcus faecium]